MRKMGVFAVPLFEEDNNSAKFGRLFSERGDSSYTQESFDETDCSLARPQSAMSPLAGNSPQNRHSDELTRVLKRGDHSQIRKSLAKEGKSTRNIDQRFLSTLRGLSRGPLKLHNCRRLRKGLTHIISDWSHVSSLTISQTKALNAQVAAVEAFNTALIADSLCDIRQRVNYIVDQIEPILIRGTHLGTLLQFLLRSLRDPQRREDSKSRYRKCIRELNERVRTTMSSLDVPLIDSP
ncbi:unnamed protein product, partial [Mesorhabditis belari]|uniref:Uncharacterized protein n=1 Tax=Mesorhabditis belari TaxID=2138241 RepID=A0AAF3J3A5_9BILA